MSASAKKRPADGVRRVVGRTRGAGGVAEGDATAQSDFLSAATTPPATPHASASRPTKPRTPNAVRQSATWLALALSLFGLPVAAQGTGALDRIQSLLAHPDTLCGKFEQAKTLVGLKNPVKSSGRFCVVANKGVLWRTLEPFPSSLRLTRTELIETQGDRVTTRMSADAEPAVRVINDLLFSLLAGDMKRLTTTFDIEPSADRAAWQATLVPREGGMKRIIRGIDVNGGEYVNHIVIRESGGDRTDITFSAIATGGGAMQPGEAKLFG